MYKIALVCENAASTGLIAKKVRDAAKRLGIDAEIQHYSYTQVENFIKNVDAVLLGPQIAYRKDDIIKRFPQCANKIEVIKPMDYGMMNGEKILKDVVSLIENKK
ncbi:PTS sugar transporter subunit IIB [Tepidanaerobacter syntrophicus]|uniref:PTS sugar transporter subunit IIB n=1 Tax=Tepidanaerobacter syntrophicus TaxID=224999 RepID=UPI001BD28BA7|nr:PTS sugar transporter subunit IIB [Tepidanaerobacter syntrophicus]